MSYRAGRSLTAGALALTVGLLAAGAASAQQEPVPSPTMGVVIGIVARCVTGVEQPAVQVPVGVDGGSNALARTDAAGQFAMGLPPGQYTIVATASDGTATRPYVPVEAGTAVDIGVLDIGDNFAGCGPDENTIAPTAAPTGAPTAVPNVATAVPATEPTPQASATPAAPAAPADQAAG